jgi:hypothetical protein
MYNKQNLLPLDAIANSSAANQECKSKCKCFEGTPFYLAAKRAVQQREDTKPEISKKEGKKLDMLAVTLNE